VRARKIPNGAEKIILTTILITITTGWERVGWERSKQIFLWHLRRRGYLFEAKKYFLVYYYFGMVRNRFGESGIQIRRRRQYVLF